MCNDCIIRGCQTRIIDVSGGVVRIVTGVGVVHMYTLDESDVGVWSLMCVRSELYLEKKRLLKQVGVIIQSRGPVLIDFCKMKLSLEVRL